ncbi:MAG: hypothetical protein ABI895_22835 [Deltaproteobacteria bacterium]
MRLNSTRPRALRLPAWLLAVLCGALVSLSFARSAAAYPQYVFKGLGDCNACHHSPTGGGLLNHWGRASLDPTWGGSLEGVWGHSDLSSPPSALAVDLGADVRLLALAGSDSDGTIGPIVVPMLTELGGAAAWQHWTAYGAVTARGIGTTYLVASREHWLEYSFDGSLQLRAGRMVLPFGIRQPDHTQYVRTDFAFDKWDQSYGLELDWRGADWSLFANGFVGDLSGRPSDRQERGGVATLLRNLGGDSSVGLSLLGATSTAVSRVAASAQARLSFGAGTYALAELSAQRRDAKSGDDGLTNLASYLRLGWFARRDLDVYAEGGQRAFVHDGEFAKLRAGLGVNWQVFGFLEFAPQVLVESRADLPTRILALGQLHLIY